MAEPVPNANTLTAEALVAALRQATARPGDAPADGPADRLKSVAAQIKSGKTVVAAMQNATPPYGEKFIRGNAKEFAGFLRNRGILTEAQAEKAAVGRIPVPKKKVRPAANEDED